MATSGLNCLEEGMGCMFLWQGLSGLDQTELYQGAPAQCPTASRRMDLEEVPIESASLVSYMRIEIL